MCYWAPNWGPKQGQNGKAQKEKWPILVDYRDMAFNVKEVAKDDLKGSIKQEKNQIFKSLQVSCLFGYFHKHFSLFQNPKQLFPLDTLNKIIPLQAWVSIYSCDLEYYMHEVLCRSWWLCWKGWISHFCPLVKDVPFCELNLKGDLWFWWKSMVWMKYQHVWCDYVTKLVIFYKCELWDFWPICAMRCFMVTWWIICDMVWMRKCKEEDCCKMLLVMMLVNVWHVVVFLVWSCRNFIIKGEMTLEAIM